MRWFNVLLLLLFFLSGWWYYLLVSGVDYEYIDVVRVIDGDTVVLNDGRHVRLLGINTPEHDVIGFDDARFYLEELVLHEDTSLYSLSMDRYGRTLGYIFLGNENVNRLLLSSGWAHLYYYDRDEFYNEMAEAELSARENQLGIWKKSSYSECVSIVSFSYYDVGEENESLVLDNSCGTELDVLIKDDATHMYRETLLLGNNSFVFHNIFNDDSDSVYVWDDSGRLIIFYRY